MEKARFAKREKAQVSVEFMLIFIFFLLVLSVILVYFMQSSQSILASTAAAESRGVLLLAKSKLDTAFLEGDGFSTSFDLPRTILNMDYSTRIESNYIVLETGNQTYSSPLLASSIAGSLKKGENKVRNSGGLVVIS